MRIGRALARLADGLGLLGVLSSDDLLAEFEDFTRRETDFLVEAVVAEHARKRCVDNEYVPAVRRDLTTAHVLSEELVEGVRLTDLILETAESAATPWGAAGPMRDRVIATIAQASFMHALEEGFFHADPHPGNVLVRPDGSVAFVDFGLFGQLTPAQRHHCMGYLRGLALGDYEASFHHYYRLLLPTAAANRAAFKREMIRMMQDWAAASTNGSGKLRERHLGGLMLRTASLLRKHSIRMDIELMLFYRLLYVLDSLALRLDPRVDVTALMRDFFIRRQDPLQLLPCDPAMLNEGLGPLSLPPVLGCLARGTVRLKHASGRDPGAQRRVTMHAALLALAIMAIGALILINPV
jgi:ubiquinone biosynthesis protein